LCAAVLSGPVLAQEPPASQPANEATTPPPEPTATPVEGKSVDVEPGAEPAGTGADEEPQVSEAETQWGIGARSYFVFIPTWLFDLFVEHSTSFKSVTFAGSVIRRKGNFDIQLSLEYGQFQPDDGLWQEKDEDPSMIGMYPDFNRFNDLAMVSFDASFIWHVDLTDFMQFRYGAGIGIGVKLGDATQTDTMCNSSTTVDDLDDPTACNEVQGSTTNIDIPPVVPIVNLLVGLRFKLVDQLSLNIEGGWRFPSFFVGGGIGYFF
jgi:hypothetical protein